MYMKKACVVSNVIGNRDVIHNGENGFVCTKVEDFVKAIEECQDENGKLTERAYQDVLKIDELYAKGIAAGALGGKLLGAGGGGFLVFYVQPERQEAVRQAMRDLLYIPFKFEDGGTRVIHYTPENYIPKD